MLTGWTQTFLGADKQTISLYQKMTASQTWQHPQSWTDPSFNLEDFDLVFLPGGHDKGIRQILDCPRAQALLVAYFPLTLRSREPKYCAAICHGVQMLAQSRDKDGISVLHEAETTALPDLFERSVATGTQMFLGDYYKTYGAGTDNVAQVVKASLKEESQFKNSNSVTAPFVVEASKYRYFSGRWPGDAKALAERIVEAVNSRS